MKKVLFLIFLTYLILPAVRAERFRQNGLEFDYPDTFILQVAKGEGMEAINCFSPDSTYTIIITHMKNALLSQLPNGDELCLEALRSAEQTLRKDPNYSDIRMEEPQAVGATYVAGERAAFSLTDPKGRKHGFIFATITGEHMLLAVALTDAEKNLDILDGFIYGMRLQTPEE